MQPQDINIYEAFMKGMSVGALAKNYKLDKSQIKKVINRVATEKSNIKSEVLYELHDDKAHSGRNV